MLRRLGEISAVKWQQPDPAALMACYGSFAGQVANFGDPERAVLAALELDLLADAAWWTRLVLLAADSEPNAAMLAEVTAVRTRLGFALNTLPKLLDVFGPAATAHDAAGTLAIRLPTPEGQASRPQRVSTAIEAVCLLWEVVGTLTDEPAQLGLLEFVAQPEPTLTFAGSPALMGAVNAILTSLWSEVVACHALSPAERAEHIPHRLPVMRMIEQRGGQDATALRIKTEQGVRLFLDTGASTIEMDERKRFTPGTLLPPAPRLLAADTPLRAALPPSPAPRQLRQSASNPSVIPVANPAVELDALIAEEREMLLIETQRRKETERTTRPWADKRPPGSPTG